MTSDEIFTPVESRDDRLRVYNYIVKNAVVIAGQAQGGAKFAFTPALLKGAQISGTLQTTKTFTPAGEVICLFQVADEKYFLKTKFFSIDGTNAILDLTAQLFKLQRRDNFRVHISTLENARFEIGIINSEPCKHIVSLFNVSAGGMAIEIKPTDKFELHSRDAIQGVMFIPGRDSRELEGEIRFSRSWGSEGSGLKHVGVQFINMTPFDQQAMTQLVLDIHRTLFDRLSNKKYS